MPLLSASDWLAFVREHLRLSEIRPEREAEIAEDLARQLDDAYRDAARAAQRNRKRVGCETARCRLDQAGAITFTFGDAQNVIRNAVAKSRGK